MTGIQLLKNIMGGYSRLVIIDDGSKDKTFSVMQEYAKTRPLFMPLTKKNGGHGPYSSVWIQICY